MASGPINSMGIIDKGDAFELPLATQVLITVAGTIKSASNAYVETELTWLSGQPRSMIVSRTDLASTTPTRFSNGASLRLEPGKYSFVGRIRSNPGGSLAAPNIEIATATLYDDINHAGTVGTAVASGSNNGFVTVSLSSELQIMAALRIVGHPPPDGRLYATMRIEDLSSGEVIATPRVIQAGPNAYPLETRATPIYPKPNRFHRFAYDIINAGLTELAVSISISG